MPSSYLISNFSYRDTHGVLFCVAASDANTFLTSDWDMPNCRAICDGLIPALVAARTALTCPRVNETFDTSAFRCPSMTTVSGPAHLLDLAGRAVTICLVASPLGPMPL